MAESYNKSEIFKDMFESVLCEMSGEEKKYMIPFLKFLKKEYGSKIIVVSRYKEDAQHYKNIGVADYAHALSEVQYQAPKELDDEDIFKRGREIEQEYNTVLHYHLADYRFFHTASSHAPRGRIQKISQYPDLIYHLCQWYDFYERLIQQYKVTFVLGGMRQLDSVALKNNLPSWHLFYTLYLDTMLWTDRYLPDLSYLGEQWKDLKNSQKSELASRELSPPAFHLYIRKKILSATSWPTAIWDSFCHSLRWVYGYYRGYDKVIHYGSSLYEKIRHNMYRVWVWILLKKLKPVSVSELKGKKFIFYPLQLEPETLQTVWSPEYFDQLSVIQQLAKEMPPGYYLAVKEHVPAIGNRSIAFYETITQMPNVVFLDPRERGLDVIHHAEAVATLAGRTGFEALIAGIPVISIARRAWYEFLPHFYKIDNLATIKPTLQKVLSLTSEDKKSFKQDGLLLLEVLDKVTFDPEEMQFQDKFGERLTDKLFQAWQREN